MHLCKDRYAFWLVKRRVGVREVSYFTTAAEIKDATRGKSAFLYVLEIGKRASGWRVKVFTC